jgi:superfamily I DNA/RNA helicase
MEGQHTSPLQILNQIARKQLSDEQYEIYKAFEPASDDSLLTFAAAGSGKTKTLSYLILKALVEPRVNGVHLWNTTRTASLEATARVANLHRLTGLTDMKVRSLHPSMARTFHSLSARLVQSAAREAAKEAGMEEAPFEFIDVGRSAKSLCEQNDIPFYEGMARLRDARMNRGLPVVPECTVLTETFESIKQLEAVLEGNGQFDFASSVVKAGEVARRLYVEARQHERAQKSILDEGGDPGDVFVPSIPFVERGDVVFVDEAQDLSRAQVELVTVALNFGAKIVALGDAAQGLFQFAGAASRPMDLLKQSAMDYGSGDVVSKDLSHNFRSANEIVRASEHALDHSDRVNRAVANGRGSVPNSVQCYVDRDEKAVAKAVCDEISAVLRTQPGCGYSDVAVLRYRNWGAEQAVPMALKDAGIPFKMHKHASKNVPFAQRLCKVLLTAFEELPDGEAARSRRGVAEVIGAFNRSGTPGVDEIVFRRWRQIGFCNPVRDALPPAFQAVGGGAGMAAIGAEWRDLSSEFSRKRAADGNASEGVNKLLTKLMFCRHVVDELRSAVRPTLRPPEFREFDPSVAKAVLKAAPKRQQQSILTLFGNTRRQQSATARSEARPPETGMYAPTTPAGLFAAGVLFSGFVKLPKDGFVEEEDSDEDDTKSNLRILNRVLKTFDEVYVEMNGSWPECLVHGAHVVLEKEAQIASEAANEDVILLSTAHKFKGLERKFVFVELQAFYQQDWFHALSEQETEVLIETHDNGCQNLRGRAGLCSCQAFQQAVDEWENERRVAVCRVDYVLLSRARDELRLFQTTVPDRFGKTEVHHMLRCAKNGEWTTWKPTHSA